MEYILEMKGIRKTFPGVLALDNVDFRVKPGEIHSLMGENGAGKSTLIKILTGVYSKDEGQILLDGKEIRIQSTIEAQNLGISTVYQELNMIPHLSVAENIYLGRYPRNGKMIAWNQMYEDAQKLLDGMGLHVEARRILSSYGTATQQMVSIARAISLNSKIIVLDEPTSSLDTAEVKMLFSLIRQLKEKGIAVIFISHRLDEVFELSDRISILKDGRNEGTYAASELTQHDLITKMIGREVVQDQKSQRNFDGSGKDNIIELKNVFCSPKLKDISLYVKKGEIVGLAGLLGSGRTETAQVIFGYNRMDKGQEYVNGENVHLRSPKDGLKKRLAFCTENRREEGIVPNMSVRDNILLSSMPSITKRGFVQRKKGEKIVREYVERFSIKTPTLSQKLKNLSGGNQQKVILARWLATNPDFIIFDEPTRGIDVGAKKEVEALIAQIADMGIGVLFISSEMAEVIRNCDRVYVMRDGNIIGEVTGEEISQDNITRMIAQSKRQ
ncbi:MAG TPA: sugar ABC transporter ATP-binding protein [Candidatus Pullichristensenella excrementigallinarum]|uniref:Sugar ABC transporter ATP-binding protein n=1 Tax=Candidatus Pullichristensenella excrementigallinarum TaxID=2840907 RepID=A0A9D1ICF6_9FIRM|nr:sugar ABC transporter ATP-binding protein [Candidatus Pullichristensenella excrementigallinarum]